MKTFEQYKNKKMEEFFIQIMNNELEIRFDFIIYPDYLFYCNAVLKDFLFIFNKKDYKFYINDYRAWDPLQKLYDLKYEEIHKFFGVMVDKYFNIKDYNILCAVGYKFFLISDYMKNNIF